jgi:hypothetical protein
MDLLIGEFKYLLLKHFDPVKFKLEGKPLEPSDISSFVPLSKPRSARFLAVEGLCVYFFDFKTH